MRTPYQSPAVLRVGSSVILTVADKHFECASVGSKGEVVSLLAEGAVHLHLSCGHLYNAAAGRFRLAPVQPAPKPAASAPVSYPTRPKAEQVKVTSLRLKPIRKRRKR